MSPDPTLIQNYLLHNSTVENRIISVIISSPMLTYQTVSYTDLTERLNRSSLTLDIVLVYLLTIKLYLLKD